MSQILYMVKYLKSLCGQISQILLWSNKHLKSLNGQMSQILIGSNVSNPYIFTFEQYVSSKKAKIFKIFVYKDMSLYGGAVGGGGGGGGQNKYGSERSFRADSGRTGITFRCASLRGRVVLSDIFLKHFPLASFHIY